MVLHSFAEAGKTHTKTLTPTIEECNKCDLTSSPCFLLANHNDGSRFFAMSNLPPLRSPSFSFMGAVGRKRITKLGCEKYFCRVTN
jgi:hypothetical protein